MNIAELIRAQALRHPEKPSVVLAQRVGYVRYRYPSYTFAQFERRSNQLAHRLTSQGLRPGDRVLLFVKPRLDFSVLTFALFKLGAVPVLIDPGMGKQNLLRAIAEVKPRAMIAETIVHALSWWYKENFQTIELRWKIAPLLKDLATEPTQFTLYPARADELAAILFTSGGTGTPKGVMTTHGILAAQTKMLQQEFQLTENDVDLPGFPLFALFTLAMGMTSVIPDMDPTKPAQCDPAKLVRALLDKQVTFAAGSPAIWERVARYCVEHKIELPMLKRVAMFGAPVRGEVHALFSQVLPLGNTFTPYGATECLPVASIDGRSVLKHTAHLTRQGLGTCVGVATPGNKIIIQKDADIPKGFPEEVGEILVQGPTVTPGYFERAVDTAMAKIPHADGLIHRMGDVGYIDREGRLWFCGRKAHVVVTSEMSFYPIPVEAIFNQHPDVKRSALVDLKGEAGVVVELKRSRSKTELERELRALALTRDHTRAITKFFVHPRFPVDVRHNIKIDRRALSHWAQGVHP